MARALSTVIKIFHFIINIYIFSRDFSMKSVEQRRFAG